MGGSNISGVLVLVIAVVAIGAILVFCYIGSALQLWMQAIFSGSRVGLLSIVFMRFRKVPPKLIVEA
ncbi:MAG: flotillin-like FloA family protein, partial [Chitinispirillales bacterium]|nr:flotillin-like FloA family protein [Chitinispirillales bacterium]